MIKLQYEKLQNNCTCKQAYAAAFKNKYKPLEHVGYSKLNILIEASATTVKEKRKRSESL